MPDQISLKWGTLKGWSFETDAAKEAAQKYFDAGPQSMSAMMQHDNPEQKQALCALIDSIDGEIWNDWEGKTMTKDEAKAYVTGYGTRD